MVRGTAGRARREPESELVKHRKHIFPCSFGRERCPSLGACVCVCLVLDRFFFLFPVCLSEKVQSIGEAIQPTSRRRESSPFCFWLRTCVELCTPFEQVSGANSLQKPAIASRRLSLENSLSDFSVLRSA